MVYATWNVRSLYRPGALAKLKEELNKYKIGIAALQEIRWSGSEIFDSGDFIMCYSGNKERRQFGTGFLINKKYKHLIMDFNPESERICTLRIKGVFFNTTIICVHAPTEEKEEIQKDDFYEDLERVYKKTPKHDIKIVMGDFNAKVGDEPDLRPNIGKHSLHKETNNNGWRMIDFAITKNMAISSTLFQHKRIHKETWRSPDENTANQIDHVMIDSRHATDILDVKSCRGADCDSDHYMVKIKYRQRISTIGKLNTQKSIKYNIDKLKEGINAKEYRNKIEESLQLLPNINQQQVEDTWKDIKQVIYTAAENTLGQKEKRIRNGWYDEECKEMLEKQNSARLKMLQRKTRSNIETFRNARREARRICRRKKKQYEEEKIEDLQDKYKRNAVKHFYEGIREMRTGFQPRTTMCKNRQGVIVGEENEVLEVWATYFKELLNPKVNIENIERTTYQVPESNITVPTLQETLGVIRNLKNNRAPGEDQITAELIKYGGRKLWITIHQLIKTIWETEQMPQEWRTAIISPIYKRGDKLDCHNYRGISLLNVSYKIFTNLLAKYIEPYVEEILGDYQGGFRKGRSTTDQIFCLRMILEKAHEHKVDIHQLYIDYKQAYDTINRSELEEIMKEFGIPNKLVRLTKMTIENTNSKVKIQGKLTPSFETTTGLRQGDALSTLLFNLCMEKIIRNIRINPGGTIYNRTRQYLAYADDVVILGRTEGYIKETLEEMATVTQQIGLQMNEMKTKYMINRQEDIKEKKKEIEWRGKKYRKVETFKYLGSVITNTNEIETEIKSKLATGNKYYHALGSILRKRNIKQSIKIRLYKTVIRPAVIYGAETWTLTSKTKKRLMAWERKILRKIYGPTKEDGQWRIKTNLELMTKYRSQNIVNIIKVRRLEWLGHVVRMDETRAVKKLFEEKIEGRRGRGRPRLRWIDDVEEDIRKLGVKRWRRKALDREEWASIIKEAKAKL